MWSLKSANSDRLLIRGIVSLLVGIGIFVYPDLTLVTVIRFIGGLLLLDGLIALLMAYFSSKQQKNVFLIFPRGTSNLIFGAFLVLFPALMVNAFVFLIGIILLFAGFTQFASQLRLPKGMGFSWLVLMISLFATIAGVVMLTKPFESAQTMLMVFGGIVAMYGIGEIIWSFKVRKFKKSQPKTEPEIVDAEYEEIE